MKNEIYLGDCIKGMSSLPDKSVNTCITSPPYYGLRDYGCDGQIGLEETPESYVQKMVDVFREVKRVLRDDGTLWLNIGDSYNGSGGNHKSHHKNDSGFQSKIGAESHKGRGNLNLDGMKPKDLIGIPWMLAFALRTDGWYLRQDIIWHKPNPMPESVRDRCTKAHEYIFLLSKSPKYYFDSEAIKIPVKQEWGTRDRTNGKYHNDGTGLRPHSGLEKSYTKANKRSVWTVTTKPFKDAHFATYPESLIVPCVLAGCAEGGLVLDPFMGAGTTALVSKKLGRNYVGFELNPEYRNIAIKRIENACGALNFNLSAI